MRWLGAALVAAVVLAGCERAAPRDFVGLWVQPASDARLQEELLLEIDFVDDGGTARCWVAREVDDPDRQALPVRWPTGTLVGIGNQLEVPGGFLVDVGAVLAGGGDAGAEAPADDPPPTGCDASAGYFELDEVTSVRGSGES